MTAPPLEQLEVRQLLSAGAADTAFSGDGMAAYSPAGGFAVITMDNRGSRSVVLGRSTAAAAGGVVPTGGNLVAYNAAGNLDTSFSADGVRPIPRVTNPTDVFIQPDGKILLTGTIDGVPGVARVLANGGADTSFSGDGFLPLPQLSTATGVRVAPDGKVIVGGTAVLPSGDVAFAAARLTVGGTLDAKFAGDGVAEVVVGTGGRTADAYALAVQSDGKIVVAGSAQGPYEQSSDTDLTAVRLTSTGTVDTGWAVDGIFSRNLEFDDAVRSVDLTPDGRLLMGVTFNGNATAVLRLDAKGLVDMDTTAELSSTDTSPDTPTRVIVRSSPDGSHYYMLNGPNGLDGGSLGRYDVDGSSDYTFGPGGGISNFDMEAFDVTADGKVVTAGNPVTQADPSGPRDTTQLVIRRQVTATVEADRIRGSDANGTYTVEGTSGNDTIKAVTVGKTLRLTLNGTTRTFTLPSDVYYRLEIAGNGGNDTIDTTGYAPIVGEVRLYGGYGNDVIRGGPGIDDISGGYGNDTLNGGAGRDIIHGGRGDDLINGGADIDFLFGDGDLNTRVLDEYDRSIKLMPEDVGADRVYGGDGDDYLYGSGNSDPTSDLLADYLDGGTGNDSAPPSGGKDATYSVEGSV